MYINISRDTSPIQIPYLPTEAISAAVGDTCFHPDHPEAWVQQISNLWSRRNYSRDITPGSLDGSNPPLLRLISGYEQLYVTCARVI